MLTMSTWDQIHPTKNGLNKCQERQSVHEHQENVARFLDTQPNEIKPKEQNQVIKVSITICKRIEFLLHRKDLVGLTGVSCQILTAFFCPAVNGLTSFRCQI